MIVGHCKPTLAFIQQEPIPHNWNASPQVQREDAEVQEVGGTNITGRVAAGATTVSKRAHIQTLLNEVSHEQVIAKMKIQARIYAACMQKLLQVSFTYYYCPLFD
jgi:hypothetical protein